MTAAARRVGREACVEYCRELVGVGEGMGYPTALIDRIVDAVEDHVEQRYQAEYEFISDIAEERLPITPVLVERARELLHER